MAIESIKNSVQFQEVQKKSNKTVDKACSIREANITPAQGSAVGKTNNVLTEEDEKEKELTSEQLIKSVIKHANTKIEYTETRCEYSYHEQTRRVSIKIIDTKTQEVIREIQPEEILDMVAKMWELTGILVDERR